MMISIIITFHKSSRNVKNVDGVFKFWSGNLLISMNYRSWNYNFNFEIRCWISFCYLVVNITFEVEVWLQYPIFAYINAINPIVNIYLNKPLSNETSKKRIFGKLEIVHFRKFLEEAKSNLVLIFYRSFAACNQKLILLESENVVSSKIWFINKFH